MIKGLACLLVLACISTGFFYMRTNMLESKNCLLESEKTTLKHKADNLEKSIEEYNKKQMVAGSTITEIRERIKYIKTDCDCYNESIPDSIIDIVQGDKSRAY